MPVAKHRQLGWWYLVPSGTNSPPAEVSNQNKDIKFSSHDYN